jgi:hypothetical protein
VIVREVVDNPDLIDTFDHFNDYGDTRRWLEWQGASSELLERLDAAHEKWLDNYWKRIGAKI